MKLSSLLLILIVQPDDAAPLLDALVACGCDATPLPSRGGFLRRAAVALVAVTQEARIPAILAAVRVTCSRRLVHTAAYATELGMVIPPPLVEIGGAVVFALPVGTEVRWDTGTPAAITLARWGATVYTGGASAPQERTNMDETPTKLLVAIVPDRAADGALAALLARHFGATTIGSTGGFLRRGNTTILSGVPSDEARQAAELIRTACLATREGDAAEQGIAFALDVAWQLRL